MIITRHLAGIPNLCLFNCLEGNHLAIPHAAVRFDNKTVPLYQRKQDSRRQCSKWNVLTGCCILGI